MWNITQSYGCTPSEAWRELGRPELSPRQLRRMTLAALELAALDRAWESVTKPQGKNGPKPDEMLRVKEASDLYNEARQPVWDRIAEECTKAEAAAGTLPEGAVVAPFTGEEFGGQTVEAEGVDLG